MRNWLSHIKGPLCCFQSGNLPMLSVLCMNWQLERRCINNQAAAGLQQQFIRGTPIDLAAWIEYKTISYRDRFHLKTREKNRLGWNIFPSREIFWAWRRLVTFPVNQKLRRVSRLAYFSVKLFVLAGSERWDLRTTGNPFPSASAWYLYYSAVQRCLAHALDLN